jgi:DNA processing protein
MHPTDLLVLTPQHPDYPIAARAMARPPERLYLRGRLPQGRGLAVVGTRRATAPALQFAHGLAGEVCRAGWSVWSGGALGIDTAAHEGALDAGGKTVVVMGTGFDHVYPTSNRRMFDRVLDDGGAWLSPYPPDQSGTRWTFLPRNELLASLVSDVAIVQAPARSGARSTTAAARRMGRNVWAVPTTPWDRAGAGCLAELQAGAKVLLNASQIVGRGLAGARRAQLPRDLSDAERAVIKAVAMAPANLDVICDKTGLLAGEASGAALTLTLRGVLLEGADGNFHRIR